MPSAALAQEASWCFLAGVEGCALSMFALVLRSLAQEYRKRRMARFAAWVAAYGAALWMLDRFGGGAPGLLWLLFWIAFIPSIAYYLLRLLRFIRARVLWRLRRRLIVTYAFIAVVPILLILLLVGLGVYIINAQFAAFLVALNLGSQVNQLHQLNRAVAHEAYQTSEPSGQALLDRLHGLFVAQLGAHAESYPGLQITIRVGPLTRAFDLSGKPLKESLTLPAWLQADEFAGIVIQRDEVSVRAVARGLTRVGQFSLVLSQPITPELLDLVGAGIGPVGVAVPVKQGAPEGAASSGAPGQVALEKTILSKSIPVPAPANFLDYSVFGASTLDPVVWEGDVERRFPEPVFLYVTSRLMTLEGKLLATLGRFSRIYVIAFVVVAAVFLILELFALVIGVRLTRSITGTVDHLYDATERVKVGDFSYRIGVLARDQLSALGEAFDSMTASVERLLRESQEKLRLESELEIAREVQTQLFPQVLPKAVGLELYGACKPARVVSGDYYDFLQLGENRIGLVLGDVSGKGISAALLMAAIQSSLRAQYSDSLPPAGTGGPVPISTAEVVARLNHQLYESTPREKYVTFFHAVYDGTTRQLTYTNAGHVPPMLFRRQTLERLDKGGTPVGLFSPIRYEQAVIQLEPGDLLLAFSDGITEPENIYGEQFSEKRLLEVARRVLASPPDLVVEEIYRSVTEWTSSPELQDDMTLVVARATG